MCVPCAAGEWWFAVKSSPCLGFLRLDREKVLPARAKWSEMGVFCCAGRVLYRFGLTRRVLGEFCTGLALRSGLPGEFCTGECALRGW